MNIQQMRDDEFKPSCPKCSGVDFVAVANSYVARTPLAIGMVVCADLNCQAVVGVLPLSELFPA
ncbi:hypothetical protein [Pseudomonas sp. N2-5-1-1]|uniref:hypothetical protein n=1 Tax=unclassified Pseudomonas TaxID=196821 RepID=UPI0034E07B99